MNQNKVIILGCGPSGGVPLIGRQLGGFWGACDPYNPKNRRMRASIYVEYEGLGMLVDTSPDLRNQFLFSGLTSIDAVLYTHEHADHTHGMDELKTLFFAQGEKEIPIYGSHETLENLHFKFSYLFKGGNHTIYPKIVDPYDISGNFVVQGIPLISFTQEHGAGTSLGYRFGNLAYSTDVTHFNAEAQAHLEGLDIWIIDCLSHEEKPSHLSLRESLAWIEKMKPKKAILTHMGTSLDYETLKKELPPHIEPAYDGMVILF